MKHFILVFLCFISLSALGKEKEMNTTALEDLELFNKVLYLVEKEYYREVDTEKLIKGAIKGMIQSLDPHSSYLPAKSLERMRKDTRGEFGGVGIEPVVKGGNVYVLSPGHKTPAAKAGIRPGDRIIEVEHAPAYGMSLSEMEEIVQGKPGTKVHLGIKREGVKKKLNFTLTREIIQISPVEAHLIENSYAYLKLAHFQKRSAEELAKAIQQFQEKSELKGILLDLRGNPGGLLDEAVDVASLFLEKGVVVSTEARHADDKDVRYVKKSGFKNTRTPMAVLIDGSSASASEIVAGALQDHERALILGSTSFGKGTVQTVVEIDEKNGMKLTIAQYMTPSGRKIQAIGIRPDISLKDAEQKELQKILKDPHFIRERDLRHHLTATVETDEEREKRKQLKESRRNRRIARLKKSSEKENNNFLEDYLPENDYQVMQSIKYLQSFAIFESLER